MTTVKIGHVLTSKVKVNNTVYTTQKLTKSRAMMRDMLHRNGCVDCRREEQSIVDGCRQFTAITNGHEIFVR